MRYEVVQLLQFVFSLSLIVLAFVAGMFVGWRRWGRTPAPQRPESLTAFDESDDPRPASPPRPDLFAPELSFDLDAEPIDAEVDLRPRALPAAQDGQA
ncbi:MAG TPA: hypothetical protein VKZ55_12185 [Microthrixaceae bacterium]|nr:hypothetical protein [Microthrixaceae bacterium]